MLCIAARIIGWAEKREPNFVIRGADDSAYCYRWWIIRRNRFFNIYLHKFVRDDDDRALHDHPWINCSIPIAEGYTEERFKDAWREGWALPAREKIERAVGSVTFRWPSTPHRVLLHSSGYVEGHPIPSWSLFFTGPVWRPWGFICPTGRWVHHTIFATVDADRKASGIGRGCDE